MTLFKVSYSKSAVYRAITALKEFDKTFDSELELFPVDNLPPRSSIQHQNISSFFSSKSKAAAKLITSFQNGVIHVILRKYYDGKENHFNKFSKAIIYEVFNYGFMMNFGRQIYKGFSQKKHVDAEFWVKGEEWGRKYIERYEKDEEQK